MELLNVGCGPHYVGGWVNTDVWSNADTHPDVLVKPGEPYPFEDNTFDAIYMGHVLEHIPWPQVPTFLADMSRIAKPSAPFLVVGPDVHRTVNLWKQNSPEAPWWLVLATMEHQELDPSDGVTEWWDGAHHHWNCHEERVVKLLSKRGFTEIESFSDRILTTGPFRDSSNESIAWPANNFTSWQFAVRCINKS